MCDHMWKSDPYPQPKEGPAWPGGEQRVSYRGLSVQPVADFEFWEACSDRWEVSLTSTDDAIMVIYADRERALAIATRLAEAKDWTAIPDTPEWQDLAFDPLVLRLMADYPSMIGLPLEDMTEDETDLDAIVPYRDDPDERPLLF